MRTPRKRKHHRLPVIFTAFAAAAILIWALPFFHLDEIEVTGLRSLDAGDVVSGSGLKDGQHLFSGLGGSLARLAQLRYGGAEDRLTAAFPVIRSVTASLDFPGKISLDIVERVEVAYIKIPDGCVMIDKDSVAMAVMAEPPDGIPLIEGVTVTSMTLGSPLSVDVPSALNSAMTLMGAIIEADLDVRTDLKLLPCITRIMPIGGRQLYLTAELPNTGEELSVKAETGNDQKEDMLWLRFALAQDVFDSRGKGVLDLTGSRRTFTPD